MDVRYHARFVKWLEDQEGLLDEEVYAELVALLRALEDFGRELEDEFREESHPVVISDYELFALRRTPPTYAAPYATRPPVIRMIYGYCDNTKGDQTAVVLVGGDKTNLQSLWYPPNAAEAERRLREFCSTYTNLTPRKKRGPR